MNKKSDFVQKLLDDLRLRKERMAVSQTPKGSKPLLVDAYAYSKQAYKGSRKTGAHNISLRTESTRSMANQSGGRSLHIHEASKEIVSFQRDRSGEQVRDLSMALAFAIESGGRLGAISSSGSSPVLKFLHQMGSRSINLSRAERVGVSRQQSSGGRLPAFSHLHIKEISKGAQKLNQILRAWSNGLSFDRYSVEIGKELLQGAIDLEESLRMLVNLQEASDHLITSQTKARITLLDEDDDDDYENTSSKNQDKQLARPRFSFDIKSPGSSRYPEEVGRQTSSQLPYRAEAKHWKNDLSASNLVSHRRGYSLDSRTPATVSERKSQSSSSSSARQDKPRIPNVVAKLMGLEDLPQDSKLVGHKEPGAKLKNEGIAVKKTADGSSAAKKENRVVENLVPLTKTQRQTQSGQIPVVHGIRYRLQDQANDTDFHEAKAPANDAQALKQIEVYKKVGVNIDHHNKSSQLDRNAGRGNERQQDNTKLGELYSPGKDTKRQMQRHELQQVGSQIGTESKATSPLHLDREPHAKDVDMLVANNKIISSSDPGIGQHVIKHQAASSQHQIAKRKTQIAREKGNEEMPRKMPADSMHDTKRQRKHSHTNQTNLVDAILKEPKRIRRNRQQDHLTQERERHSSTSNNNPNDALHSSTSILPTVARNKRHFPATKEKEKAMRTTKDQTPRKIDEPMTRKSSSSLHPSRQLNQQESLLQEMKQRMRDRLSGRKEAQKPKTRSKSTQVEPRAAKRNPSFAPSVSGLEELETNAIEAPRSGGPAMIDVLESYNGGEQTHEITSTRKSDQKVPESCAGEGELVVYEPFNVVEEVCVNNTNQDQHEELEIPPPELQIPEPLTENENCLKNILISSQAFLNAAHALFRLDIPLGTQRSGSHDTLDQESRLLLDCGYEIMRRKGRKQESGIHPLARSASSIRTDASVKVTTLDDLVKQLHSDFGKLELYGRSSDNHESVVEECYRLPVMLECDIYNTFPDTNCMWDCGWEGTALALLEKDEVVREVEKSLLNGLIDEVTRDLVMVF